MAIQIALNHKTQYRYDRLVKLGPQIVRLRPAPHCRTTILSYSLKIHPKKHFLNWQQDPQANYLARLVFTEPTTEFLVEVDLVAEMAIFNPFDFFLEPYAEKFPFTYDDATARDLRPFLETEPLTPALESWLSTVSTESIRTIDFLTGLNQRLRDEIGYVIRTEPGVQTCEETLTLRSGSCRDSAWLLVQILRNLGLGARFVSGYLIQTVPDVKPLDGPAGPSSDFTDLHAWTEVYLPGAGWVGLDPTSGLLAGEGHIPLACTPDASSAAPISGTPRSLQHDVPSRNVGAAHPGIAARDQALHRRSVERNPRARQQGGCRSERRAMSGSRWAANQLSFLSTMPTRRSGPPSLPGRKSESCRWNFSSGYAIVSLPERCFFSDRENGIPANRCPRWALSCYWRKDGIPIWEDQALFAGEAAAGKYNADDARRFLEALTRRLEVDPAFIMSAYEDTFYYLWRERRLPVNVDALDSKIKDPIERNRLARIFEQDLGNVIGYVLPLRRIPTRSGTPRWTSQPWFTASQQLFLVPGDSPLGYRLPLESLPWTKPEDVEYSFDPDPFKTRDKLPERPERKPHLFTQAPEFAPPENFTRPRNGEIPKKGESATWVSRPALCVQVREGKLYVFMPPLEFLADYLDLIAAIEDTAAYLRHADHD